MSAYVNPVLETPLNPVNSRRGAAYSGEQAAYAGGRLPNLRLATEGNDLGESERHEQDIDSDTSETELDFPHIDSDQEWYTDEQIQDFISYTRLCYTSTPPRRIVTFYNVTTLAGFHPSPACEMLREAARAGLAQLARSTSRVEVYTVDAPPPVPPTGYGEHWWLGMIPAQIRAGPLAENREVRNAERSLQRDTQAKRDRNTWLNEEREKTEEGVRRQEEGRRMSDDGYEDEDGEMGGP